MKNYNLGLLALFSTALIFTSCSDDDDIVNSTLDVQEEVPADEVVVETSAVGAVYAMTNGEGQVAGVEQGPNSIVTYSRAADGTLALIESVLTEGNGGDFDGGEGLDPLISAYALTKTRDNSFVLAANAGSNSISALPINQEDYSLGSPQTIATNAIGPNSIDTYPAPESLEGVNSLVLVTNITREDFFGDDENGIPFGEPRHRGTIDAFWLLDDGTFSPAGPSVDLGNRPSCVHISPDGAYAIVTSINAGAAGLDEGATDNEGTGGIAVGNQDEIVLFSIDINTGSLTREDADTSTERGNDDLRNLPSAIGSQIVEGDNGRLFAVVTEAREFQYNGAPPAFNQLQDGSVSTWEIVDGGLRFIETINSGTGNTGRTACWLDFSDENTFFVSNAIEAGLVTYSFDNGNIALVNPSAASGIGAPPAIPEVGGPFDETQGWIDMWISDDGEFLYQLYGLDGTIGVFRINGESLIPVEEVSGNLPENNTQGIVAI